MRPNTACTWRVARFASCSQAESPPAHTRKELTDEKIDCS